MVLLYRGGTQPLIWMRALAKQKGDAMTIYYRILAQESDTLTDTVFEGQIPSYDDAIDHAERWAAEYYGGKETTWSTSDGDGRYLVGHMHENGDREPVTCVITVEQEEIDDEDEDVWSPSGRSGSMERFDTWFGITVVVLLLVVLPILAVVLYL